MRKSSLFLVCVVMSLIVVGSLQAQEECRDAAGGVIPCPATEAPPDNSPPDRDGDGVPDNVDRCPDAGGPAQNGGCPQEDTGEGDSTAPQPTVNLPVLPTDGACVLATQTANVVNVRQDPSLNAQVIGVLQPTQIYTVLTSNTNDDGLWYLVQEVGGWVFADVVRLAGDCDLTPQVASAFLKLGDIKGESQDTPPAELPPYDIMIDTDGSIDVSIPDGSPFNLQIAPYGGDPLPPELDWFVLLPDAPDTPAWIIAVIPDDSGMSLDDLVGQPQDTGELGGDYNGDGKVDFPDFIILSAESRPTMVIGNMAGVLVLSPKFLYIPSLNKLANKPEPVDEEPDAPNPFDVIGCYKEQYTEGVDDILDIYEWVDISGLTVPINGSFIEIYTNNIVIGNGTSITFNITADSAITRGILFQSPYNNPGGNNYTNLPDTAIINKDDYPGQPYRIFYEISQAVGSNMTATLVCS